MHGAKPELFAPDFNGRLLHARAYSALRAPGLASIRLLEKRKPAGAAWIATPARSGTLARL
jgi:hypothetical protein